MDRDNELSRKEEPWRPPPFASTAGRWGRFVAFGRRALDLQAASIWRDLREPLASLRGVVLDVGAGSQPYRGLLSPSVTYRAIDIAEADEAFGYRNPDTVYFSGDVWPVEDDSVDAVLTTETLEHVPDPDRFLAEADRVLRRGGRLVLTVPFSARWHYISHDYWRFTPLGLKVLLERNGFTNVVVHARGNALAVAMLKCSALILPLLASPRGRWRWPKVAVGLLLSPLLAGFALIGQSSLRARGGTDCLGYTVFAETTRE